MAEKEKFFYSCFMGMNDRWIGMSMFSFIIRCTAYIKNHYYRRVDIYYLLLTCYRSQCTYNYFGMVELDSKCYVYMTYKTMAFYRQV
jgi:hypothetical protein